MSRVASRMLALCAAIAGPLNAQDLVLANARIVDPVERTVNIGVHPGDEAHVVVLDDSPVESVENTQRIAMVVMRGRVVYPR